MESKSLGDSPNISGVPEEIQKNIIEDLIKDDIADRSIPVSARIGVSVSDNEDLGVLGFSAIHLLDLTIEIVRHLLINNISVVYGGDLRKEGYTEIFSDLSYQYRSINDPKKAYFINYFAYPIYHQLTKQHELDFKRNRTDIVKVSPPDNLQINQDVYLPPTTLESKFIWAKSLTKMRNVMIGDSNGRILVGGKTNNYLGKMPGVIEEAMITLAQKKPLYLIGALGGSALQVINALKGSGLDYGKSNYHNSEDYTQFKSYYNEKSEDGKIDTEKPSSFFADFGVDSLSDINGLSIDENERLFQTPHISEMLYYVFKGLRNCLQL